MAILSIDKCDAAGCGFLCLRACPLGVLLAVPEGEPGEPPQAPASYSVEPAFERSCNVCGACIEVCPRKAIRLAG